MQYTLTVCSFKQPCGNWHLNHYCIKVIFCGNNPLILCFSFQDCSGVNGEISFLFYWIKINSMNNSRKHPFVWSIDANACVHLSLYLNVLVSLYRMMHVWSFAWLCCFFKKNWNLIIKEKWNQTYHSVYTNILWKLTACRLHTLQFDVIIKKRCPVGNKNKNFLHFESYNLFQWLVYGLQLQLPHFNARWRHWPKSEGHHKTKIKKRISKHIVTGPYWNKELGL